MILTLIVLNKKPPGVKFIQIWCTFSGAVLLQSLATTGDKH